MDDELEKWLNSWSFSSKKTFAIKILLLNLLLSQRIKCDNGYKSNSVVIKVNAALTYRLDAAKLQLDHLEANVVNQDNPQSYYLSYDIEKRQKDVNGYIGNFMILDAADNNQKNNVPLKRAMKYYAGIETSWLVSDIKCMINDNEFFDDNGVPKEEFFIERTRRLKKYFKAFLNKKLDDECVSVYF